MQNKIHGGVKQATNTSYITNIHNKLELLLDHMLAYSFWLSDRYQKIYLFNLMLKDSICHYKTAFKVN